jgi:hypothetical protein
MKRVFRILALALLSWGCFGYSANQDQPVSIDDAPILIMADSEEMRSSCNDKARIRSISVQQSILIMDVSFGGGCEEHEFSLYSLPAFRRERRIQADLYLSHDGKGDLCKALVHKRLIFNLLPLLEVCNQQFGRGQVSLRVHEPGDESPKWMSVSVAF